MYLLLKIVVFYHCDVWWTIVFCPFVLKLMLPFRLTQMCASSNILSTLNFKLLCLFMWRNIFFLKKNIFVFCFISTLETSVSVSKFIWREFWCTVLLYLHLNLFWVSVSKFMWWEFGSTVVLYIPQLFLLCASSFISHWKNRMFTMAWIFLARFM